MAKYHRFDETEEEEKKNYMHGKLTLFLIYSYIYAFKKGKW